MTLHVKEGLDLTQGEILPIAQGHKFIESAQEFECIPKNFPLVQTLADAADDLREEMKGVNVLQDVRLPVGDQNHVELV